jgi:hypothetical protein
LAASILTISIPLLMSRPNHSSTQVADRAAIITHPATSTPPAAEQVNWPEILATLDEFPRRLEELGPVYVCTAQMTGVASLTSPWSLTVDLLRNQWNREPPHKNDGSDSSGRNDHHRLLQMTA